MKNAAKVNPFQIVLIVIILVAVLARRFYFKSYDNDSLMSFFLGVASVLVVVLIYKIVIYIKAKRSA
jgi:putative effector of murein hydrolase